MRGTPEGDEMLRAVKILDREKRTNFNHPASKLLREKANRRREALKARGEEPEALGGGSVLQVGLNGDPTLNKFLLKQGLPPPKKFTGSPKKKAPSANIRHLDEKLGIAPKNHPYGGGFGKHYEPFMIDELESWNKLGFGKTIARPIPPEQRTLSASMGALPSYSTKNMGLGRTAPSATAAPVADEPLAFPDAEVGLPHIFANYPHLRKQAQTVPAYPKGEHGLLYAGISTEFEGRYDYLKNRRRSQNPHTRYNAHGTPMISSHEVGWAFENLSDTAKFAPTSYPETARGTMLRLLSEDAPNLEKDYVIVNNRTIVQRMLSTPKKEPLPEAKCSRAR